MLRPLLRPLAFAGAAAAAGKSRCSSHAAEPSPPELEAAHEGPEPLLRPAHHVLGAEVRVDRDVLLHGRHLWPLNKGLEKISLDRIRRQVEDNSMLTTLRLS